jgi:hypothetical protein
MEEVTELKNWLIIVTIFLMMICWEIKEIKKFQHQKRKRKELLKRRSLKFKIMS